MKAFYLPDCNVQKEAYLVKDSELIKNIRLISLKYPTSWTWLALLTIMCSSVYKKVFLFARWIVLCTKTLNETCFPKEFNYPNVRIDQ